MTNFRYGPVELHLVGFAGEAPTPEVLGALGDLLDTGLVRLLDFLLVTKAEDGTVEIAEIEGEEAPGLNGAIPQESGIVGDEDLEVLAEAVAPGTSAAVIAVELSYQRELAEKLAASGAEVLRTERIPAPVVNAILDLVEQEEEGN